MLGLQGMEAAERLGKAWLMAQGPDKPAVLKVFQEGLIPVDGEKFGLKDLKRHHVVISGDPALFLATLQKQPKRCSQGLKAKELKVTISAA